MVMVKYDKYVHEDLEVDLWSVGGEAFSWRRRRGLKDNDEFVNEEDHGGIDSEEGVPSLLRGVQVAAIDQQQQQQDQQPHHGRKLEAQELKFELIISTKCNSACQSDTLSALGTAPFNAINAYFQTIISEGVFTVQLKTTGENMGIFANAYPSASDGELLYRYAVKSSDGDMTWAPSPTPTYMPTEVTETPTVDVYWPDVLSHVCKTGTKGLSEFAVHFYGFMEDCCRFPWMDDYDDCMENSRNWEIVKDMPAKPTRKPVPRPTKNPTPMPTNKPTKKPKKKPTRKPKKKPTMEPTKKPVKSVPAPPAPTGDENQGGVQTVYYPDLTLGVCKFDGLQGNSPYQFTNPVACCTNQWMNYDKCMAYADPYGNVKLPQHSKFYPDIYEGFCRSDGKHVDLAENLVYDSAAECCDNIWMVYADCFNKSLDPNFDAAPTTATGATAPSNSMTTTTRATDPIVTPEPTPWPTRKPVLSPTTQSPTLKPSNCKWHADPRNWGTCAFTSEYPTSWLTSDRKHLFLFATHEACCVVSFGGTQGCGQGYDCNDAKSGPSPTGFVSLTPTTHYPTFNPTYGDEQQNDDDDSNGVSTRGRSSLHGNSRSCEGTPQ